MYNFQIVKYYNTNSDIHNLNPVIKIICVLLFTFTVLLTHNTVFLLFLLIFLFLLMIMSNVPLKLYLKNIKFLVPFILFIFIINLIFNSSMNSTINSIIKLILLIMYASILTYTTKPNDLTYALSIIFKPLKIINVPVNELALSISLAIRFIPNIFIEAEKVLKSQKSRGLNFNGTLKEKCDKLVCVLLPIFLLSFKRADNIAEVLEMRLYSGNTIYKDYKLTGIDEFILLLHTLIIFLYVMMEVLV